MYILLYIINFSAERESENILYNSIVAVRDRMSSNKSRDGPKNTGGGGGSNKTAKQISTTKPDLKSDKADLNTKKTVSLCKLVFKSMLNKSKDL